MESLDLQVSLDSEARSVNRVPPDPRDRAENGERKDNLDPPVNLDLQDNEVNLDLQDHRDLLDPR